MTSRRSQGELRRTAILDATLRLVAAEGLDAITHRAVAAEAGVPLGSTTYYFASREALLEEAFRHYLDAATDMIVGLLGERSVARAEDLAGLMAEIGRREFSGDPLVVAEYELILYASRIPELARAFNAWQSTLTGLLAEGIETLGYARPVETARGLVSLLRGFEIERLTRPEASFEELHSRLLNLLRGAGPEHQRTPHQDWR